MAEKETVNTQFLTDAGLDTKTAEKMVAYGVTEFEDLAYIDFEDEDFKKLELNKIQLNKLKKLVEKAQCRRSEPEMEKLVAEMTDGPWSGELKVERCTKDFYDKNKKESYSMEKKPRGGVLIINVNEVEGREPRHGTDVDRDKLTELFKQLHFIPTVYNDEDGLSAQEIKDKVEAFAKKANKEQGEAYVVCLLSDGANDCLSGTDGELLPFDTVFGLFDDKNCPNLVGKPKLFFIHASRKEEPNLEKRTTKTRGRSDMLVSYATQAGYEAFRHEKNGSWLVEAITKVFARYAHKEDIVSMMNRVHYAVQQKLKDETGDNVSPEVRQTLGKKFFFFPGIPR